VDKALAHRGGAELVALWAQLSSLIEIIAGVAAAGVASGLSVLIAQTSIEERQQMFLQRALRLCFTTTLPVALGVAVAGWVLFGELAPRSTIALAAIAGWIAIGHVVVNSYWLGHQQRARMLALATASAVLAAAAAALAPRGYLLELLVASQAAPALALFLVLHPSRAARRADDNALERYIVPGFAIGVLSPASLLVARSLVGESLSWHESGVLQALWRLSDWVCGLASGIMAVLYLPRLAAAHGSAAFRGVVLQALGTVLLPSAALFALMFAVHGALLELLYDETFRASPASVAFVFAGNVLRIASWIALYALYAAVRTRAIAVGELLSLPLFAGLLFATRDRLTLELAGVLWLTSYAAYCAFNFWALARKVRPDRA
jgi:O-antigen/teichoic acid export membrane protein